MELLKRIFCKHKWKIDEECIVHYPDYEPHKVGVIKHCEKCSKVRRELYYPNDFIEKFGIDRYQKAKGGK